MDKPTQQLPPSSLADEEMAKFEFETQDQNEQTASDDELALMNLPGFEEEREDEVDNRSETTASSGPSSTTSSSSSNSSSDNKDDGETSHEAALPEAILNEQGQRTIHYDTICLHISNRVAHFSSIFHFS